MDPAQPHAHREGALGARGVLSKGGWPHWECSQGSRLGCGWEGQGVGASAAARGQAGFAAESLRPRWGGSRGKDLRPRVPVHGGGRGERVCVSGWEWNPLRTPQGRGILGHCHVPPSLVGPCHTLVTDRAGIPGVTQLPCKPGPSGFPRQNVPPEGFGRKCPATAPHVFMFK